MLFNFLAFVEELREKEDKKQIVEKYESLFGTIEGSVSSQLWYKEYLSKFPAMSYLIPEDLEQDFDWDLLQKLILGSFSSDYEFKADAKKQGVELFLSVRGGDQTVVKTVSELWSFQVLRLYEIYVEEQMNYFILMHENEEDKGAILAEREMKLKKWAAVLATFNRKEEAAAAQQEQAEKLDDLMGQL